MTPHTPSAGLGLDAGGRAGTVTGPATMRAIRQTVLGGPDVLELVDVPRPQPGPTEVVVRVTAAGVNPLDWKTRARGVFLGAPPFTVGADVAGVVEAVSDGVTRLAPGDRVYGMPRFPHEAGAYAEFVTAPSRHLAHIPPALGDVEAAALPMAGLTAWQALVDTAEVGPGDRVLIHGAAGGIGHLAVQIAKARGAVVLAAARPARHPFLAALGVDAVLDSAAPPVAGDIGEVEVVLDLVGGDTALRSLPLIRDGGLLIGVSSGTDRARDAAAGRVRVTYLLVEPDHTGLEALAALAAAGALRPHVAQTFPLAQAARAHRMGETGRAPGKLVLTVP
jgi:NADPH:quinone reductase-like Zn-dependent oxidoreductase